MLCPACGHDSPAEYRFCESCGVPFARACRSCGFSNRVTAKFCGGCGSSLAEPAEPSDSTPPPAGRAPPAPVRLLNERKQVTVLFADIKDSSILIHGMDPEQAAERLQPALQAMQEAVHRYGGTVNRIQGDGIMALFGAPIAHEDHAVRACYAALAMRDGIRTLYEDAIAIRIGLHSGEVVVRSIGNDFSVDYDAQGPVAHLAGHMEKSADPGTIRLSAVTYGLAEQYVAVRSLGRMPVKGAGEPVEVYELAAIKRVQSRWAARAAGGLSKFVGRGGEIEALQNAFAAAWKGRGRIVCIVGDPGIGKSRLVHEFLHAPALSGATILLASTAEHDRNIPYKTIGDLIRFWCLVEERDSRGDVAQKLHRTVLSIDPALAEMLPALESLLDLPVTDEAWANLAAVQRRQRTLDAVTALILRSAAQAPVVLAIEDLHWIDAESLAVFEHVVNSMEAVPLLLIGTHRPEFTNPWIAHGRSALVRLNPLAAPTADELLVDLLGASPKLVEIKRLLMQRASGTPLFLEEMIKALVETGVLAGQRGDRLLAAPINEIRIPVSVQAVLAARIDRLAPGHKTLLQMASVIGTEVPVALLQGIAELPEVTILQMLAELQTMEMLYESQRLPTLQYNFAHALTHDVAYSSMLLSQRRKLHAKVLEAIETRYADRLEEHVEHLAYHALNGEQWEKAAAYLYLAGRRAIDRSAFAEAVRNFDYALDVHARLPSSPESVGRAIDTRFGLRIALLATGHFDRIRDLLSEAEKLAASIDDRQRLARISIDQAIILSVQGDLDTAVEKGRQGRSIAASIDDRALRAMSGFALGQACWFSGQFREALSIIAADLGSLRTEMRHHGHQTTGAVSVLSIGTMANSHTLLGNFEDALNAAQEARQIAGESRRPYDLSFAEFALGFARLTRGNVAAAIPHFDAAFEHAEASGIQVLQPFIAGQMGRAYALAGRSAVALELLEGAISKAIALHLVCFQPWCEGAIALARFQCGETSEAVETARHALAVARKHNYRATEAALLTLLGRMSLSSHAADLEQATAWLQAAVELTNRLEMRPESAHALLYLGNAYQQSGRAEEGRSRIVLAEEQLRHLGMTPPRVVANV